MQRLEVLVEEMPVGKFVPDTETLIFAASIEITKIMPHLLENPDDLVLMEMIATIFRLLLQLSLNYNLWESQNRYFLIGQKLFASKLAISRSRRRPCETMDGTV